MSSTKALCLVAALCAPRSAEALICEPALPVFCQNVHIGCSGKTRTPTAAFEIRVEEGGATIVFEDAGAWRTSLSRTETGDVFRRHGSRDWVRVAPDMRFSQRVYLEGGPVMAFGRCRSG